MSILNENLEFHQLPSDVQIAFAGKGSEKVLLKPGTSLFRFSRHTGISPWWSETTQLWSLLESAKKCGQRLDQHVRSTNAVLRNWDPSMHFLIIAKLKWYVYAFRGKTSFQNEAFKYMNPTDKVHYKQKYTKPILFKGGNSQVYIYGIKGHHLNIIVNAGAVLIYDPIDDILNFLNSNRSLII